MLSSRVVQWRAQLFRWRRAVSARGLVPRRRLATIAALVACAVAPGAAPAWATPDSNCVLSAANQPKVTRDIVYDRAVGADLKRQSLDVLSVTKARQCPVMIWVHGGSWVAGDKANVRTLPEVLGSQGFILVSINYRFPPAVNFDGQSHDVAAAIAWVYRHIAEYGGDPQNIFLIGHSAGAHLISLVATDPTYLTGQDLTLSVLRGVVSLEGDYDLRLLAAGTPPRVPDLYIAPFTQDPANWWKASPLAYVKRGSGIAPFVLAYSGGARPIPTPSPRRKKDAEVFIAALTAAGIEADLVGLPSKSHTEIAAEFGAPGDPIAAKVFPFLENILGRR